ncbi:NADH:flavin oxidoreductase [Aggregicoccus sp. 17bor-14]|uniref:oxidoreductase n=1 Tax=Myxococcaceae TaxID=31 RepID=UPI00129C5F06|nr:MULTISPECIES: NADH:flavin oxidoreductase [Myxococcaceae]MBF5042995.1 NADH:flavin oxidoreductase [Simulacricoccus sp. 17bor-14]MRI88760.1 NADH:flavin oxidoreductase [Aggregicoccus sp. 17bor-14]
MDRRTAKLLPVSRWPTREEAERSRWFSPLQVGPVRLAERTWVPAMVPWRATEEGFVTPEVLAWYRRFAEGQPGALVVEATGIRDVKSGPLLRVGHARYVDGLKRLVETVREASGGRTRLFLQIIDFLSIRRRPTREAFLGRFLQPSPALRARLGEVRGEPGLREAPEASVREALLQLDEKQLEQVLDAREREAYRFGARERVTDVHLPHVAELPRVLPGLFAAAAARALEAGFDGVELHFAHAYTMASFLSRLNTREDGYGGTLEGRLRLPLEVYRAVRAELGSRAALGCRFLGDEVIEGGSRVEDACAYGVAFARAGMDFLSLSKGGKFEDARQPKVGQAAYPYTGVSGAECMPTTNIGPPGPFGRNVGLAARVRAAVRDAGLQTPVVACGGIASFWQAEEVLARGEADAVAAARQTLADPDWFRKVRLGQGEAVRRCLFTNYCEGLDQAHKAVTCQLWDRTRGLPDDAEAPRTPDGRRLVAPPWAP